MRHAPEFSFSFQSQPYYYPFFTLLIGAILATAPHSRLAGKLLDNRFFRFTAKVSFGLYIWHYLVIFVTADWIVKDYQQSGMGSLLSWTIVSLAVIAVSYGIATLSYRFVEKPILDRAHKNLSK